MFRSDFRAGSANLIGVGMCSVGLLNTDITDADCTLSTDDYTVSTVSVPVTTDTDIHRNIGDLYDPHIGVHWRTDTFSDTETISHTDFTEMSVQWNTDTLMLASIDCNLYRE
jgi:hypothetical protein